MNFTVFISRKEKTWTTKQLEKIYNVLNEMDLNPCYMYPKGNEFEKPYGISFDTNNISNVHLITYQLYKLFGDFRFVTIDWDKDEEFGKIISPFAGNSFEKKLNSNTKLQESLRQQNIKLER